MVRVRAAARKWLHLPHDVPKALFHAHTADGGLGIPEILVQVPLMRRPRVNKLFDQCEENRDPVFGRGSTYVWSEQGQHNEMAFINPGYRPANLQRCCLKDIQAQTFCSS